MSTEFCISKDNLLEPGVIDVKYSTISISNNIFFPLKIGGKRLVDLEDLIEFAFDFLLEENGTILIMRTANDFRSVKPLEKLLRIYLAKGYVEFICQCIDYESKDPAFHTDPITIHLIGMIKNARSPESDKVRFISMPDKVNLNPNFDGEFPLFEFSELAGLVPFTREECLYYLNFIDVPISEILYLEPHHYFPLNAVDECINGILLGDIMNVTNDICIDNCLYGLDFTKFNLPDILFGETDFPDILDYTMKFDPINVYDKSKESRRFVAYEDSIIFSPAYKSLSSILLIQRKDIQLFPYLVSDDEIDFIQFSIHLKPESKGKVDLEYLYLETRKPYFYKQFPAGEYISKRLNKDTILKAKIAKLPSFAEQRKIVKDEKDKYLSNLTLKSKYIEKEVLNIPKKDISHSIGNPLRAIKAFTGYLYEYFESENSSIPIDTIIKQSAHTYSIRRTLDKIYEEVIKGENWIDGKGLDINKPLEKSNINSLIIYQLEKCSHEFYKFIVRNNVSGLENTFVDVNDNFDYIFVNLLSNANRHAFKERSEKNIVDITSFLVIYNNRNYLNISISNNGLQLDVSLKEYISYGIKGKTSGHTGIGGSDIYGIVKSYQGFLGLKKGFGGFSVTFDILLPIADEYLPNKIISDYEPDEIE